MIASLRVFTTAVTDTFLLLRASPVYRSKPMEGALCNPLRSISTALRLTYTATNRVAMPVTPTLSGLRTTGTNPVLGGFAPRSARRLGMTNLQAKGGKSGRVLTTAAYTQGYNNGPAGGSTVPVPPEIAWDSNLCNNVSLIGRLGRDPIVKVLGDNMLVANTSLAVSRGNKTDQVDWVDLSFWNDVAMQAKEHLSQGQQIHVQGRLKQEKWMDKQSGQQRSKLSLTVFSVHRVQSYDYPSAPPAGQYGQQPAGQWEQAGQQPAGQWEQSGQQPAGQWEPQAASTPPYQPTPNQPAYSEQQYAADPMYQPEPAYQDP
eukprot:CAMPEP_0118926846 /NCGR_PEP_ID=MMETSP1169-20130426/4461_1 /TAXON_ID=36882 /ORGANISM="Pyramimonas obovata, Strain CCMP722" /LENGTH=315 /DNA_ID=CAMNT_0006868485 /DNA_START=89 /DNA_END=1033 /DNA_ORIENTATION=-